MLPTFLFNRFPAGVRDSFASRADRSPGDSDCRRGIAGPGWVGSRNAGGRLPTPQRAEATVTQVSSEEDMAVSVEGNPRMVLQPGDRACVLQAASSGDYPATGCTVIALSFAPVRPRSRGGLSPRALRRVCEYVEAHLNENISIRVLAETAGLSMYHFARVFKQSMGVTPHGYLVQCRVRRAQELLAGTDLPLSEIALASGFSDQSHCARRFREHIGVTPRGYRWSMR
jgi:transcriptional regulator GlxA family with amidase domain